MKAIILCLYIAVLPFATYTQVASAQDDTIEDIFKKVIEYTEQGRFPQAMTELSWAQKELQKKNAEKLKSFFPETLAEFKGGESKTGGALGMTTVERSYKKESSKVKVSLTGGSKSGLGNSIAGIAQMGAMFGAQGLNGDAGGMDSFRIDGQTANLKVNQARKKADLTVFLSSGSILKFEMQNGTDGDALKLMAKEIKVADINSYLKAEG